MSTDTGYVLEVVKFILEREGPNGWSKKGGRFEHIGYMKAKFKTKEDACSYYDRYNPHMRPLNKYNTYKSDWDPKTKLLYIVRENYNINDSINPFSIKDIPKITSGVEVYEYLK